MTVVKPQILSVTHVHYYYRLIYIPGYFCLLKSLEHRVLKQMFRKWGILLKFFIKLNFLSLTFSSYFFGYVHMTYIIRCNNPDCAHWGKIMHTSECITLGIISWNMYSRGKKKKKGNHFSQTKVKQSSMLIWLVIMFNFRKKKKKRQFCS